MRTSFPAASKPYGPGFETPCGAVAHDGHRAAGDDEHERGLEHERRGGEDEAPGRVVGGTVSGALFEDGLARGPGHLQVSGAEAGVSARPREPSCRSGGSGKTTSRVVPGAHRAATVRREPSRRIATGSRSNRTRRWRNSAAFASSPRRLRQPASPCPGSSRSGPPVPRSRRRCWAPAAARARSNARGGPGKEAGGRRSAHRRT